MSAQNLLRKNLLITEKQDEFLKTTPINLSKFLRLSLDELMKKRNPGVFEAPESPEPTTSIGESSTC